MSKFDFCSMSCQIPLAESSRRLFRSSDAGDLGSYQFNRVAMGALNSSIYAQRMVTQMFSNVQKVNGQPLLGNGLMVQTDDVLLYAGSEEEMLHILDLFFKVIACHNMVMHASEEMQTVL